MHYDCLYPCHRNNAIWREMTCAFSWKREKRESRGVVELRKAARMARAAIEEMNMLDGKRMTVEFLSSHGIEYFIAVTREFGLYGVVDYKLLHQLCPSSHLMR